MPFIVRGKSQTVSVPYISLYEMADYVETMMGNTIPTLLKGRFSA